MCDLCVPSIVLKIGVVIVPRIRILDASTEEYIEEEEDYFEEEENFDHYSAQGKLTLAKYKCLALQEQRHHHTLLLCITYPMFLLNFTLAYLFQSTF